MEAECCERRACRVLGQQGAGTQPGQTRVHEHHPLLERPRGAWQLRQIERPGRVVTDQGRDGEARAAVLDIHLGPETVHEKPPVQLPKARRLGLQQQLPHVLGNEEIEEELALRREQRAVDRPIVLDVGHIVADQTLEKGTYIAPVQREHAAVGEQNVSGGWHHCWSAATAHHLRVGRAPAVQVHGRAARLAFSSTRHVLTKQGLAWSVEGSPDARTSALQLFVWVANGIARRISVNTSWVEPNANRSLPPPPRVRAADIALFLDINGTLLEIEREPGRCACLSISVAFWSNCKGDHGALALVSVRSLAQLDRLFSPWFQRCWPTWPRAPQPRPQSRRAAPDPEVLEKAPRRLAAFAEVNRVFLLEDKALTLALHFRTAPRLAEATLAVAEQPVAESAVALVAVAPQNGVRNQTPWYPQG